MAAPVTSSRDFECDLVVVGGCGHVGLPLGLAFADAGKQVVALDRDAKKVEATNKG